jgi:DNA (cytosine-5)-methyltransferase 1
MLILSLFPGVDLLGRAFEAVGYCVVRGPELFLGQDIRKFTPPPNLFWGVIGGPPCQDFSQLRRTAPTGYGLEMLYQFARVVYQARPQWWLMENVPRVPDLKIAGYHWQRIDINQGWFEAVTRLRHYQFGSVTPRLLNIPRGELLPNCDNAALASDDRPLNKVLQLQGLPPTFADKLAFNNGISPFKKVGIKTMVGNGVPLIVGKILANEIKSIFNAPPLPTQLTFNSHPEILNRCQCPCKRSITPPQAYYDYACRKRMERRRIESKETVTWPMQ